MKYTYILITFLIVTDSLNSLGQNNLTICNSFDSSSVYLKIDSSANWEIGKPTKLVFNNSYSDTGSIVTSLDSSYLSNDTSVFYVSFFDSIYGSIPNYLGSYSPIQLSFTHRFITDSIFDFGSIEMSFDGGDKWYNVLSNEHNASYYYQNYHFFENTGDTIYDSIVITGNSGGWVHSVINKEVSHIIWNDNVFPDSIIFKFSFISDSLGVNEGWQIDDICLSMDYFTSTNKIKYNPKIEVFPSPTSDIINVKIHPAGNQQEFMLELYDVLGRMVLTKTLYPYENIVFVSHLKAGVYGYRIGEAWGQVVIE